MREYIINYISIVMLEGANDTQSLKSMEGLLEVQRRLSCLSIFSYFAGTGTQASLQYVE